MEIIIAGAGAGKTTTMADKIIKLRSEMENYLKIFCITFTNNAVECIKQKLQKYYGDIPDSIVICTIHSFLYQEFIKPYYFLLYEKHYEKISVAKLSQNSIYKNATIKRLEEKNILHQTVIPQRAKWVLVKKSNDLKAVKEKREIIRNNFKNYCGAICIDEAQDVDKDMLEIIKMIDQMDIQMILMGDPKQDLKGHNCLRKLIELYPTKVVYKKICHRCPQSHLIISNLIVPKCEQQYSKKLNGSIVLCFENDKECDELITNMKFDLLYISKKQGIYETHGESKTKNLQDDIFEEVKMAMRDNHPDASELILMRNSFYLTEKLLQNYEVLCDKTTAISKTFKKEKLNKYYGRIINLLPNIKDINENKKIRVYSIDAIKGQEGYNCLFILTTDLAAYLFGKKMESTTTKNKLYVALTRSLDKLTIYITSEVEKMYGKTLIISFFQKILDNDIMISE